LFFNMSMIPNMYCKIALEFSKEEIIQTMTWPNVSPDLNPMEHHFEYLNQKVEQHNPFSEEQLKRFYCRKLV
uniref:Tc1-like transposase DDE domain-containing protein n=1 Tax=Scophthalmus maximus TaxID=52904 RepID=A0A8D3A1E6_SCOMX